jgi:hypothetical protein
VPPLDHTIRQVLALPREAGTPECERARARVADHLRGLGSQVTLQRFAFHPSGLLAFPIFGAGLGGVTLLLLPLLSFAQVPAWGAMLVWLVGLGAVVALAAAVGLGWLSLGGPRREDANLIATRGAGPVRRWIVAHLDSKAQAQSMAGRLVAVWVIGAAIALLTALALLRLNGPVAPAEIAAGAGLALGAGVLAGRGRLRGRSLGARDNGTGLVAALAAAESETNPGTGILITGAEEFGLVGSRIFARLEAERARGAVVLNLDTIDQEGDLSLVSHDARGEALAREEAPRLAAAGVPLRIRRLPLGILVDSLPFARRGVAAITIGRLTWRTLRLIHTPRDTPEGLSLEMAKLVGQALAVN